MNRLPYSEDVEAALIARLLFEPRFIPTLRLSPDDFYVRDYRDAWRAMLKLTTEGRPVDIVTLREENVELGDLLDSVTAGHRAPIESYAEIVRRDAFRRRVIEALDRVSYRAAEEEDQQALLAELQDAVTNIMRGVESGNLFSMERAVEEYEETLKVRQTKGSGVPYGIPALDRTIQPAQGGDMIVLAARPSVGKTALAEHIADHWAVGAEHPVLFASIEMSQSQLLDRAVARATGIEALRITRGQLNHDEMLMVQQALEDRRSLSIYYLDNPHATTTDVRAAAAKLRMTVGGLRGIVVDYLQILKDHGDQEVQRVTRISREVKAIAREFDVPLLVLSQLNRASEMREDKHPRLSDLRESGAIEQDADVVLGLWRFLGERQLDLDILKNRNGPVASRIFLDFDPTRVSLNA